jgi:L-alanine-DL-glutamate epimerase-like enolase superfamily enzyme
MKITQVEALYLRLPEINDRADGTQDTLIVRVHTDAGIVGLGEVDSSPLVAKAIIEAPMSHFIARGLAGCVIGENPLEIELLWHKMYRGSIFFGRGGAAQQAISGIDMALWDIAGKVYQQPVYKLLGGGFNKRLRAYASILFGDTPEETYEIGRRWTDAGFTAVKFGWGPLGQSEAGDIAHIQAARRGVGDQAEFMIDAGLAYDVATAIRRAHQFAEFRPYWFEEALHPDDYEGYAKLAANSPIRVAAGEQDVTLAGFERLLDCGLDILQPDVARVGGLTNMRRIGQLAASRHRMVVNHSYKTGVSVAASLHALAALPNTYWLEYCVEQSPLRQKLTRQSFPLAEDGFVPVPEEPGLGVELNEEIVEKYLVKG